MSKKINWRSGLQLSHQDLREQDDLQEHNSSLLLIHYSNYYYGIKSISINRMSLIHGILHINAINATFPDGTAVETNDIKTLDLNAMYQQNTIYIYIELQRSFLPRYILDSVRLNCDGSGMLLGKISISSNGIHLSSSGCYLDLHTHNYFIQELRELSLKLSDTLTIKYQNTLTFNGEEYAKALFELMETKQLVSDLLLIQRHIHHPFDAYCLLNKYIPNCSILYDHNDNITSLHLMLEVISNLYSLPGRKYTITSDDKYYQIPISEGGCQLLITPYSDSVFLWLQNVHISNISQISELEQKRHKGLQRKISIRHGNILVDIFRDNNYIGNDNIVVMECNPNIKNIYLIN